MLSLSEQSDSLRASSLYATGSARSLEKRLLATLRAASPMSCDTFGLIGKGLVSERREMAQQQSPPVKASRERIEFVNLRESAIIPNYSRVYRLEVLG